jgi:hypothetical protein
MLHDTQRYVASIIFRQPRPASLFWSPDYQQVTIAGETLNLDKFRYGIQCMFVKAWELLFSLTGGKRFATHLPEQFTDDLRNDTRGYSFLDHGPFTETPHALLSFIIEQSDWKIASIDAQDRVSFNIPALHGYLDISAQLNQILAFLCFVCPTIATRISEFTDNKYRNLDRNRNLHMMLSEMFDLVQYHKMTNLTGIDVCIPTFYPPILQDIMLEYLAGGIRDVDEFLGRIVYGEHAAHLYHS